MLMGIDKHPKSLNYCRTPDSMTCKYNHGEVGGMVRPARLLSRIDKKGSSTLGYFILRGLMQSPGFTLHMDETSSDDCYLLFLSHNFRNDVGRRCLWIG